MQYTEAIERLKHKIAEIDKLVYKDYFWLEALGKPKKCPIVITRRGYNPE